MSSSRIFKVKVDPLMRIKGGHVHNERVGDSKAWGWDQADTVYNGSIKLFEITVTDLSELTDKAVDIHNEYLRKLEVFKESLSWEEAQDLGEEYAPNIRRNYSLRDVEGKLLHDEVYEGSDSYTLYYEVTRGIRGQYIVRCSKNFIIYHNEDWYLPSDGEYEIRGLSLIQDLLKEEGVLDERYIRQ
ncbi:MAG: hypothetical protein H8D23_20890 [Candidatus Brocadiales bacterium]|nr:hypothetical protein [Candidatus Brocadiales bacterium]